MKVRIGTRGSDLALWQARHVGALLERAGCAIQIVVLETRGDRIDDVPLHQVEGQGFFTAEIERALLEHVVDLAVHSHKDLPSAATNGLVIAGVPVRAAAGERLLVRPEAHAPAAAFLPLRRGARVGTSAPRRTAQIAALRPDLETLPLRGNVPTRVRRLREGRFEAIVLAAAGLDRLGLDLAGLVDVPLAVELLVPAPGQGALAVQTRAADGELRALCTRVLHDAGAAATVEAERHVLVELGGGCNLPLGVTVERTGADGPRAWRATAFLGAGCPDAAHGSRWTSAHGASPMEAAAAAGARLASGERTTSGPLGGLRIALAGTEGSAEALARRMEVLGAAVVREVVLDVEDLDGSALPSRVARLGPRDAVAVTSASAARRLRGLRIPEGVRIAAVGPATARALEDAGHRPDLVGGAGARELAGELELQPGARVLFPCAEEARPDLERELAQRGVAVERVVLYRTRRRHDARIDSSVAARVYLSPSAVEACRESEARLSKSPARFALGSATAEALEEHSLAAVALGTDPEDALATLAAWWTAQRERQATS